MAFMDTATLCLEQWFGNIKFVLVKKLPFTLTKFSGALKREEPDELRKYIQQQGYNVIAMIGGNYTRRILLLSSIFVNLSAKNANQRWGKHQKSKSVGLCAIPH